MKTTIYTSDVFLKHDTGHNHPERIARLETLLELFKEEFSDIPQVEPRAAEIEEIAIVHPESYIYDIMDKIPDIGYAPVDAAHECILSPPSWEAIMHAAGAGLHALDDIMDNKTDRAFCAIRPPGHHAERSNPMGFCFFNNAFITALTAQEKYGLSKVAIIDFDVHHGNGTDALTRAHNESKPDSPLFYASSHQYPLWPMSGLPEDNTDHVINVLLKEGANGEDILTAYKEHVLPTLQNYAPELLIFSAGFDAHKDDPLAGLNLEVDDFGALTHLLIEKTASSTKGRVISFLEGGYDISALRQSVSKHLTLLLQL